MSTPEWPVLGPDGRVPAAGPSAVVRVMVASWAVASAAASLFAFLSTTMPVRYPVASSEFPIGPRWIPGGLFTLMVLADLLVTFVMPLMLLPLLAVGLRELRGLARGWWAVAWAGAITAAVALEVIYLTNIGGPNPSIYYTGPALPDWAHLADTAGFLVLGAVMIRILAAARRSAAPRPRTVSSDLAR